MAKRLKGVMRALQVVAVTMAIQSAAADELTGILMVEIAGLKNSSGDVYIAVYDSESSWLGDETVLDRKVAIAESLDGDLVRTELHLPMGLRPQRRRGTGHQFLRQAERTRRRVQ